MTHVRHLMRHGLADVHPGSIRALPHSPKDAIAMHDITVVDLSRLQFAATALYHFLFVPLTLGLSFLLAAMETVYVTTGKEIYRQITQFWGKLFLINFALGVATGLTMEFEFGTNWSFYSSFVGDIFGAPLAIEGLMAFFLEATFIGLMVFGWDRLQPRPASGGDLHGGAGLEPVGAVDPGRQQLHAGPGRRQLQPGHHAHGAAAASPS